MPNARPIACLALCACTLIVGLTVTASRADEPLKVQPLLGEKNVDLSDAILGSDKGDGPLKSRPPQSDGKPKITAMLTPTTAKPGDGVTLSIHVKLPPKGYTYSLNPPFSGRTQIEIKEIRGLEALSDEFVPDRKPKREFVEVFGHDVEKHTGEVTWKRVYQILPGADLSEVSVQGAIKLQSCDDLRCLKLTEPIDVTLLPRDSTTVKPKFSFSYQEQPELRKGKPGPATVRAEISPVDAKPGEKVTFTLSIAVEEGWHTYSTTQKKGPGGLPTTIEIKQINGLTPVGETWQASESPENKTLETDDGGHILQLHHGNTKWSREFVVADDAESYGLAGRVQYMTCDANRCLPPKRVAFDLGNLQSASEVAITTTDAPVKYASSDVPAEFEVDDAESAGGLSWYLLSAFLGGMILNIMPCVLPVLAIKVMSFVQQAGESRSRIFALNAAYSGGVITVFLLLASLAVGVGLGWGGLFQNSQFNLVMACVVFAMGLSLLGVFEIPVPGLVGASAGGQQREGLPGAFMTGVLATLLATPCSGPFLGATLGWSVRQSPMIVYLVWATMGLGMAFPYVVFGLFPHAIKWLPKPGNWMVRMKEFAGFILMGTVIFFVYFLEEAYVVPLLIMLLGIGMALWMIGNLYDVTSHIRHKMTVRVVSIGLAAVICGYGYSLANTAPNANRLPWEDFSEQRLQASLADNKTVLVDFTADWCLTCKTVEKIALNTAETKQLVEQHEVVTLYADYTHESPVIKRWLDKFKSESVPLTVIFPANQPNRPIVIRDVYTKSTLLEKLNAAVEANADGQRQASAAQAAIR